MGIVHRMQTSHRPHQRMQIRHFVLHQCLDVRRGWRQTQQQFPAQTEAVLHGTNSWIRDFCHANIRDCQHINERIDQQRILQFIGSA